MNLKERLQPHSLQLDDLPAAIQDAITVTRNLGIKYIWIDALCMIQDNLEDKHGELSNMSQYYRNSFLTIASSTPSCTTGFIGTMGRCENHPNSKLPRDLVPLEIFAMEREKDRGRRGTVYAREENPYQLSREPINQRAWTLQECILAPRVLMFGSRVMWLCQHGTYSDGGIEAWSLDENNMEQTRREFQIALSKRDKSTSDNRKGSAAEDGKQSDMYQLWHRIVGTYSQRALTHSSDKFPAISAVAAEFATILNDDYLAGAWRSNLLRDLLWTTQDPATHKPETWRAPSWSWASINDAVRYDRPPPITATCFAKVVAADVVPLIQTVPFGEIEQSQLVITAPRITLQTTGKENSELMRNMFLKDFNFKAGKSEREFLLQALRSYTRPEPEDEMRKERTEYELPEEITTVFVYGERDDLAHSHDNETDLEDKTQKWIMWGLVLKQIEKGTGDPTYERVLSFSQVPCEFQAFDKFLSDQETFCLV